MSFCKQIFELHQDIVNFLANKVSIQSTKEFEKEGG